MRIYPAIDIKNGVCVRLLMGDMNNEMQYGDPVETALRWESMGAEVLHIVDLDAAVSGSFSNRDTIAKIVEAVKIPVQLGGGIRNFEDIKERLEGLNIWRVIIGTAAIENPSLLKEAVEKYPGRIVVGIDAKDGKVSTRGWTKYSDKTPASLALDMKGKGINTVIYTDIKRDGMLSGPDIEGTAQLVKSTGMEIIASGGVSSLDDIKKIKDTGAEGVITGKALYSGNIDLREAIRAGAKEC